MEKFRQNLIKLFDGDKQISECAIICAEKGRYDYYFQHICGAFIALITLGEDRNTKISEIKDYLLDDLYKEFKKQGIYND